MLPILLLGIRATHKEDPQASSAEILYRQPLHDLVKDLRRHCEQLKARSASRHINTSPKLFIPQAGMNVVIPPGNRYSLRTMGPFSVLLSYWKLR